MLDVNFYLLIAVVILIISLALIMLTLAIRYDKETITKGAMEDETAILARVKQKREELAEINEKLRILEEIDSNRAKTQAEVQELQSRKEELLAEWNMLDEKRSEVREIRLETEQAVQENQNTVAELTINKTELEDAKGKLENAKELLANSANLTERIELLNVERERLAEQIAGLHEQRMLLEEAESKVASLENQAKTIETHIAEKSGLVNAKEIRLEELQNQFQTQQAALNEVDNEFSDKRIDLKNLKTEIEELHEQRGLLEEAKVKVAALENEARTIETQIAKKSGLMNAEEIRLEKIQRQFQTQWSALSEVDNELGEKRRDLKELKNEIEEKTQEISRLESRKVVLEDKISNLTDGIAEGGVAEDDPKRLLNLWPEVISNLKNWNESIIEDEEEALKRVKDRIGSLGLRYEDRIIRAFHTSMKVNDKTQLTVLAGISGTGKTQLPRQYAAGMGIGFLQVPVQPRWDSPQDLMGFYNYIEKQFRPTDMAKSLWAVDEINNQENSLKDRMLLILFDEMNLARVEYYFSDFLSRLESRPARNLVGNENDRKDSEIELDISNADNPPKIFPNFNVFFAGTMNEDESTQSLSDKVVDRSNIMRFHAPLDIVPEKESGNSLPIEAMKYSTWESWLRSHESDNIKYEQARVAAKRLSGIMKSFHRPFGYRLGDAITAYVMNYPEGNMTDPVKFAIADQIEMRLLPKLRGVDVSSNNDYQSQFDELKKYVDTDLQDEYLANAISESCENAHKTGQFVWGGVLRS